MPPFLKVDGYIGGVAAKGGCYLCGASKRSETGAVVDTAVTIDFEGRILICEACVREMGHLLDLVDSSEVAELRDELDGAKAAQHVAEAAATEAKRLATDALAHAAEQAKSDEVATERTRANEAERELRQVRDEVLELVAQRDEAQRRADAAETGSDDEVARDASTGRFVTDDEADDNPEGTVVETVHRKRPPKNAAKQKETHA